MNTEQNGSKAVTPLDEPVCSTRFCVTHHHACDCREKATGELIRDLMELALDNRLDEDERSFVDPARRYVELRNEAVRLGYHHGKVVDLDYNGVTVAAEPRTMDGLVGNVDRKETD